MKYLFCPLILLIFSCKDSNEKSLKIDEIKIFNKNKNLFLLGEIKDNKIPNGLWTFYDDNGKLILELEFDIQNNSNDFLIKQYDSNGLIAYDAYYSNGKILKEKSCLTFNDISYENGRYLFNKYLDSLYYNEYGKIKGEVTLYNLERQINYLRTKKNDLPLFSENQMKAILCYLNPKRNNIRI